MKRFFLLPLLVYGPALANDRAESEAKLAALSDQVIVALGAAVPKVDGMTCSPSLPDKSVANRMFLPTWRGDCVWSGDGETEEINLGLILSASAVDVPRTKFGMDQAALSDGKLPKAYAQFFGDPEAVVKLTPHDFSATPSDWIAIKAIWGGDGVWPPSAGIVALAEAIAVMDTSGVEGLPEV